MLDPEIAKLLIEFGGGTAMMVALYYVLDRVFDFVQNRNNNKESSKNNKSTEERIAKLEKTMGNDMVHQFFDVNERLNNIDDRLESIDERLRKVEQDVAVIKYKIK